MSGIRGVCYAPRLTACEELEVCVVHRGQQHLRN